MNVAHLDIDQLTEAPWNPNHMDQAMMDRLRESISRYGVVAPLVVRPMSGSYEVLSGNQRLKVLQGMGFRHVTCVVVDVNDAEARLLAQAMNDLHGDDDLGVKGDLLKVVLETVPESRVLSLLPETAGSLRALATLSKTDMAEHLMAWQKAQAARLRHLLLHLTEEQMETVEEAISLIMPQVMALVSDNPNRRGTAVYLLCRFYLHRRQPE